MENKDQIKLNMIPGQIFESSTDYNLENSNAENSNSNN